MEKPTWRWRISSLPEFTNEAVLEAERILDLHIHRLAEVKAAGGDQQRFEEVIRDTVLALNAFGGESGKFPFLIRTTERDELVDFIEETAIDAGYELTDDDVTFHWRDW